MKRFLIGTLFLAALGLALAGPPVDYRLYCEADVGVAPDVVLDAEFVGVASEVEGQLHVALIDGALAVCDVDEGFVIVAGYPQGVDPTDPDAEAIFLTFEVDGMTGDLVFVPGDEPEFDTAIVEVPQVAIEGMFRAQQNRAAAFQRAEEARARAEEHAGGPPIDVPEVDATEAVVEIAGEEDGPPMELPEPATRGRP